MLNIFPCFLEAICLRGLLRFSSECESKYCCLDALLIIQADHASEAEVRKRGGCSGSTSIELMVGMTPQRM